MWLILSLQFDLWLFRYCEQQSSTEVIFTLSRDFVLFILYFISVFILYKIEQYIIHLFQYFL